jgi:hypothetical protein
MSTSAPFIGRPAKPKVARLDNGRIGIFVGSAYEFTDDAGARSLRQQLDDVLEHDASTGQGPAE